MKTAKAILLNGYENEIIEMPVNPNEIEGKEGHNQAMLRILDTNLRDFELLSFGYKYLIAWQTGREERTSLELGIRAGFPYPQFLRSKVIIFRLESKIEYTESGEPEEVSKLIDVDMKEIEEHFNTSSDNMFWTLIKM